MVELLAFLAPASTMRTSYWFSNRSLCTARNFISVSLIHEQQWVPVGCLKTRGKSSLRCMSSNKILGRNSKNTEITVIALQGSLFFALNLAENIASRAPRPESNLTLVQLNPNCLPKWTPIILWAEMAHENRKEVVRVPSDIFRSFHQFHYFQLKS